MTTKKKRPPQTRAELVTENDHLRASLGIRERIGRDVTRKEVLADNRRLRAKAGTGGRATPDAKPRESFASRLGRVRRESLARAEKAEQDRIETDLIEKARQEGGRHAFKRDLAQVGSVLSKRHSAADREADEAEAEAMGVDLETVQRMHGTGPRAETPAGKYPHLTRLALLSDDRREAYRKQHAREILAEIRKQAEEHNRPKSSATAGPCHAEYRRLMDAGQARLARRYWVEHEHEIRAEAAGGGTA